MRHVPDKTNSDTDGIYMETNYRRSSSIHDKTYFYLMYVGQQTKQSKKQERGVIKKLIQSLNKSTFFLYCPLVTLLCP
jgi:hypothetical protein